MIRRLRRLTDTVAGQVTCILLLSVLALHVLMTGLVLSGLGGPPSPPPQGGRLAAVLRLLDATPAAERSAFLARIEVSEPDLAVRLLPDAKADPAQRPIAHPAAFGPSLTMLPPAAADPADPGSGPLLRVQLSDGTIVGGRMPAPPPRPLGIVLGTLAFLGISVTLFVLWAVRAITAPLGSFARAAETFGTGAPGVPLAETGPAELRGAIAAFNRMQARIGRLIDDRTRMLGAVSHDLRTPITRLRLRAEFIEDETLRDRIVAELDEIAARVQAALAYLRGDSSGEPLATVDLPSLVQTLCDHAADLGRTVAYEGPERLNGKVRPGELGRALQNLVENALRHASSVTIRLDETADGVVLAVLDDGPGIPPAERERLMEPFARGDEARGLDAGTGFGLGLGIARAIAEAHGGRLDLADNPPRGLAARIILPAVRS